MMKPILAIDPGKKGGICLLTGKGSRVWKMPDEPDLIKLLKQVKGWNPETLAVVEQINTFLPKVPLKVKGRIYLDEKGKPVMVPDSAMASGIAKLYGQYQFILGVLTCLNIKTRQAPPRVWQKGIPGVTRYKGRDRKRKLKEEAHRRYPMLKPTMDTCDAILIADYGRMKWGAVA